MTTPRFSIITSAIVALCIAFSATLLYATKQHYVLTNDDVAGPNTVTVFRVGGTIANPTLTRATRISTGGQGMGGGALGMVRQALVTTGATECFFAADGGSSDIAAIDGNGLHLVGNFKGSSSDDSSGNGMGLATNGTNFYASFTASNTIASFAIQPNCALTFLGDVPSMGINGGFTDGMAARGNILVVTYGDGTIQSFNISRGGAVSNRDLQFSSGYSMTGFLLPSGVDIDAGGAYAVFGDLGPLTDVEVSNIGQGKLMPTVNYTVGTGLNSGNVWFSPNNKLVYVSNSQSGQVTGLFFDISTGTATFGCISPSLRNHNVTWSSTANMRTAIVSGTGSVIWIAEKGTPSSIGMVEVSSGSGKCSLTEAPQSPVPDTGVTSLESLAAYPTRNF